MAAKELAKDLGLEVIRYLNGQDTDITLEVAHAYIKNMCENLSRLQALAPDGTALPRFRRHLLLPPGLSLTSIMAETDNIQAKVSKKFSMNLFEEERPAASVTPAVTVPPVAGPGPLTAIVDSVMLLDSIKAFGLDYGVNIHVSKCHTILYIAYAQWLSWKEQRIPIEHPQVWKFGPIFPNAYYDSHLGSREACCRSQKALGDNYPELYCFLEDLVRRTMNVPQKVLSQPHCRPSSPWGISKRRNGDKFGCEISDELIMQAMKQLQKKR